MEVIEIEFQGLSIPQREVLNALLEVDGYEGFWIDGELFKAYVQIEIFNKEFIEDLLNNRLGAQNVKWKCQQLENKNWNAEWEAHFSPVKVSKELVIRAPFHEKEKDSKLDIVIQPNMSFGTGHHQTTELMARYLIENPPNNLKVLDMGCGTGVLAIISNKLGAIEIDAIDVEQNAVKNTKENLLLNDIHSNVNVYYGGKEVIPSKIYHLIIANINKNILINQMSDYARHLVKNGKLMLSGFFTTDENEILNEGSKNSLYLLTSFQKENWSMLVLEKK